MPHPTGSVILPARGELGLKIRYHVPIVHAVQGPKLVYCERGEEALYPSASSIRYVASPHDGQRRGMRAKDVEPVMVDIPPGWNAVMTRPGMPEARFVPKPLVHQGINAEVVLCPRHRDYGSNKNWDAWPEVSEQLCAEGVYVFAAGTEDSSYDVVANEHAWNYGRVLDACIEAMSICPLVVATDAGLAHLAVLCGAPLLMVTYGGLVAPGPVVDADGTMLKGAYWPVKLEEYYHAANHTGSRIEIIDGWEHPDRVVDRVLEILEED